MEFEKFSDQVRKKEGTKKKIFANALDFIFSLFS